MSSADASPWPGPGRPVGVRLRGRQLVGARAVWVVVAGLVVALFGASLPAGFAYFRTVCTEGPCSGPQLSSAGVRAFEALGLSVDAFATYTTAVMVVFAAGYFALAGLIFWRKSDEPLALLASLMLVMFGAAFPPALEALGASEPAWRWPSALADSLGICLFTVFFYLFPDGRFVPAWTRALVPATVAVQVPASFFPHSPLSYGTWPPPLVFLLFLGWFGTVLFAQIHRYRHVSGLVQRQQTKWVVFGVTLALVGFLAVVLGGAVLPAETKQEPLLLSAAITASYLFMLLVPLSMTVAIFRRRLWDIDLLVNRTLAYGALTAAVVGFYVLLVDALVALFRTTNSWLLSLVTTGVVAVLFQPLRERLQRAANRMVYGERDDPYAALSRLGRRLAGTLAPEAILPAIVETVAEALKLPYAAIALRQGDDVAVAAAGQPPAGGDATVGAPAGAGQAGLWRLPLIYQQEQVGELLLAPRAPGEAFSPADRRLLDDLARQAGVAAHAVRLTADLRRSRERLVTAREEERRRLRRDLHDGLGPSLGSLMLKLGVADDLVEQDPAAARALLRGLKGQTQAAIAEIRRLVHALRPPALDDLGLVAALHEQVGHYEHAGLRIAVEAPEQLPPLPAAVEVAAYRIAQEALTNVVRHAGARTCLLRLTLADPPGALTLEISDDGRGLAPARGRGVGLASMRERAEELGGTCEVASLPAGGTRVRACVPYGGLAGAGERRQVMEATQAAAPAEEERPAWTRSVS